MQQACPYHHDPALVLRKRKKSRFLLIWREPGLSTYLRFAARSASLFCALNTWKNSILWKERARHLFLDNIFLSCKLLGRCPSAIAWITILESPNTMSLVIPLFLAITNPCHRAKASAMLFVSDPRPQAKEVSRMSSGVKKGNLCF